MKLLGFDIRITRETSVGQAMSVAPASVRKSLSVGPEEWLRGEDGGGGAVLSNAYQQVVWVYRAVNALAEQVANVPFLFSIGERGRERLLTSGPLLDFYARPHPQLNRFQYWELRVIWLMLRGECFRVPIYENGATAAFQNPKSKIKSVLLLDPAGFRHIIDDHRLVGWRYTGLGPQAPLAAQVFLPEEVWFDKLPNPFDFWRGFPPLYAAGFAAQTDFAAGAFMRGLIENNADSGVIVRAQEQLSDEQQAQIIAALNQRKRRAGQADRPLFLNGVSEIVKPQLSSTDLQFLENRKFSRAEICAAFGVPEEIVTTTDNAKYDVMAGARLNFIENRVAPLCSRLEAEEEATVKSLDPQASGWFDLDSLPPVQEARRSRLAAARAGFEMGVPFNELNRVFDLGFRPLPWGDRGYVGSKLQEVGSAETREAERGLAARDASASGQVHAPEEEHGVVARANRVLTGVMHGQAEVRGQGSEVRGQRSEVRGQRSEVRGQRSEVSADHSQASASPLSPLAPVPSCRGEMQTDDPQLTGRLRRFLFEQRGRVLASLASVGAARERVDSGSLLDLAAEDALLAARLGSLMSDLEAEKKSLVAQFNQKAIDALQQTLRRGLAAAEDMGQLTARVRAFYNEAAARDAFRIVPAVK